ncbi:MAG: DUF5357 family protein [Synechococcales bacterium]|nr:DUF5357 family protein [Synechococcales bacterium]
MKAFFQQFRDVLWPKQPASWQTLILLSLFSAFIAFFTSFPAQNIIATCGWIFLILGTWWFVAQDAVKKALTINIVFTKVFLGAWVVGALICLFVFGSWGQQFGMVRLVPTALIVWPIVSAGVTLASNFITSDGSLKTPKLIVPEVKVRQGMVLFLLGHLLIACWFQFYFLLQGWLTAYPSILADDFSRSVFVYRVQFERPSSRGKDILSNAEAALADRLKKSNWGDIERWLFENQRGQWVKDIEGQVEGQLRDRRLAEEDRWWILRGQVKGDTFDTGAVYNLQLDAVWQGPSSQKAGYYLRKTCELTPRRIFTRRANSPIPDSQVVGRLKCSPVGKPQNLDPKDPPNSIQT